MEELTLTMKLHLTGLETSDLEAFASVSDAYRDACNAVSGYAFDNSLWTNKPGLHDALYHKLRAEFGLKSQMAESVFTTVTARYKTIKEQLFRQPFRYKDESGKWCYITRTLEWLQKPVHFSKPQADLVYNRDYSFVENMTLLSINTLNKRRKVRFAFPECFMHYFDGTWKFGTAKLVRTGKEWYLHISISKKTAEPKFSGNVAGIDRGLRFLATMYDSKGKTHFFSGEDILRKRDTFNRVRAELQSKGTKSAKRVLKRISGRENRWMTDVNHRLSKTLVDMQEAGTLFALEDLTGVSFSTDNFGSSEHNNQLRSWAFYQLEQFMEYKALMKGSAVIRLPADYSSQRCPVCGRINKDNRNYETHEYVCDECGYSSNDDRIGAMNMYALGVEYLAGNKSPRITLPVSG